MADDDGMNAMQAHLGLTGGAMGSMSPYAQPVSLPTPSMPVRSPGDVARDITAQTQMAAQQTMMMTSLGTPNWNMGSFAAQYRNNMAGIQAAQLSPWQAGNTASMMGMGGFMPGMLPSPTQMTAPNMGIYRTPPPMPMGQIPPLPPTQLVSPPFSPAWPTPQFSTPGDHAFAQANHLSHQMTGIGMAVPGVAGRLAADVAGSRLGGGLGALVGARFGGGAGAAIGSAIGSFAGLMGTDRLIGSGVQGLIDRANPFATAMQHTRQVQGMSGFVVGGPHLNPTGTGLAAGSAAAVGRQLSDIAGNTAFQRETGGMFSTQDLMKITQHAGNQGLLDMAQRPEQITGQVKNIARALKSFMQLANEPDVTEAIKQIGQMRQMGLSLGESMMAAQNAKMFGRMAGTSTRGIMEAGGLQGAMVFQQQGLSAGLGMNVGMGAFGLARQAVASGTFTPQQLSMLGGTSGVAQRNMEISAAMLKQPMLAAAMGNVGAGGTFGLNANNISALAQGKIGIQQMATMGVNNLMSAVGQQGVSALASFQMMQPELQDQVGRALGPIRTNMLGMQQMMQTQKMLGLKGPGGAFAAAKAMGMTDDQARQKVLEMNSPEYFQNIQRQIEVTRADRRASASAMREATEPSLFDNMTRKSAEYNGLLSQTVDASRELGRGFGNVLEGTSALFAEYGENRAARKSGQSIQRTPRELLMRSSLEARTLAGMTASEFASGMAGYTGGERNTAIFRTGSGRGLGSSETLADLREFFGGDKDDLSQLRDAQGGWRGTWMGKDPLVTAMMDSPEQRARDRQQYRGGAELIGAGVDASSSDMSEARSRVAKTLGGDKKAAAKLTSAFATQVAKLARGKRGQIFGNEGMTEDEFNAALVAAGKETGIDVSDVSLRDVSTAGMSAAQAEAGYTFNRPDLVDNAGFKGNVDTLLQRQVSGGNAIFGEETGLMGFGESSRRDVEKMMFGEEADDRVSLYASLLTAARREPDNTEAKQRLADYRAKLSNDKDGDEIMQRGAQMADRARLEGNEKYLAQAGKTNATEASNVGGMEAIWKKRARANRSTSGAMQLRSGYENLGIKDKSIIGEMDANKMLQRLGSNKAAKENLSEENQALVDRYMATSGAEREKIATEFQRQAFGAGTSSETKRVGGTKVNERDLDTQSRDVARTAQQAAENFPEAAKTLLEAGQALQRAADKLGGGTNMTPAVNDWNPFK